MMNKEIINQFRNKYPLSKVQLAHILGQCAHESANFKVVFENLNYSRDGLLKIFKKYFTPILAQKYARQPQMIASRVYANRMGNGDEASMDGYKFRGRGYIQLTGRSNYIEFTKFIGDDCLNFPDLVATKYPLESAYFFFYKNGLLPLCKDASVDTIKIITKRVNGGFHGLDDRAAKTITYFNEI